MKCKEYSSKKKLHVLNILCISDQIDPLIYSSNIKKHFGDVDLILSAGDLDLPYYSYIVSSLNKPLVFVFGNHNLSSISRYRKEYQNQQIFAPYSSSYDRGIGAVYTGFKIVRIKGLLIAGLGGSMKYNAGKNQFTDFEMFFRMLKMIPILFFNRIFYGRFVDILLTHAPPFGIHDREDLCHRGFKTFLLFMKWFKPIHMVHGHVHLYDLNAVRTTKFYETLISNAYEHLSITVEVP